MIRRENLREKNKNKNEKNETILPANYGGRTPVLKGHEGPYCLTATATHDKDGTMVTEPPFSRLAFRPLFRPASLCSFNPYTQQEWETRVKEFEKSLQPLETAAANSFRRWAAIDNPTFTLRLSRGYALGGCMYI